MQIEENAALVVIDVQKGFEDEGFWGRRDNPDAEGNIAALIDRWQETGRPVVFVRHDSVRDGSPLKAGTEGNAFKDFVEERRGKGRGRELLVTKHVNSAFYGQPSLDVWLTGEDVAQIVVVGIQTNMCNETTARMGGNLGFDVVFALDAMHTFDLAGPFGWTQTAEELTRATAVSLHGGQFARVVSTEDVLKGTSAG
ncbi:cysteine hydrolase family protein [Streptomyces showdoensis]|uniref:cysteine hydrolase family protein n=1 Tax=Streptomyces showdoensis TaxID=68268 RepID=UPI0031EFFC85